MTSVLIKRGNLETETHTGRLSYEDEDKNWDNASQADKYQILPANHQTLGEGHGTDFISQPAEGTDPALILAL